MLPKVRAFVAATSEYLATGRIKSSVAISGNYAGRPSAAASG
jgi:hypothetical protein